MGILMATCLLALFYGFSCLCKLLLRKRDQACYLLAYECHMPPDDMKLSADSCLKIVSRNRNLGLEEFRFLLKTITHSGIGEETYCARNIIQGREETATLEDELAEMDGIIFDALDKLFALATSISPSQIDILVINVSMFSPAPSLSSRIVSRYKMRDDIKSFNLSGMGCSATLIAIDVVQNLFKSHKNANAIVVSTESLAPHWYCGVEKSMMLTNCLFRSGGCAMLLTNNRSLKHQAKLKLNHLVRMHTGSNDEAYNCCIQVEDESGNRGFRLTKYLVKAATQSFTKNLQVLAPKMLPLREILRYLVASRLNNIRTSITSQNPKAAGGLGLNLKTGIEHFCVHPGGRAIIDGIGKSLGLSDYDVEPSRMALHRFGNTSAAGFWYALGYMEAKKRLKKGNRILMSRFGAGFKCNNIVWEVMKDLDDVNVWKDCIDSYPRDLNQVNPFMEKYGWINDDYLGFVRFDMSQFAIE
ncbi:3-ketoacyl-CoA synthase 19-like [Pyrus x bretschneideri]|uniref:3-ketoacyl-CoA synthase 19-like n=1 Tax=Pyrus x bretschneideri TaxID=225117 RepID=UPI00202E68C1|nr:3-ketoacyl-CoA synthase 19-like [Pyrus x bretschneideri]